MSCSLAHGNQEIHMIIQAIQNKTMTLHFNYRFVLGTKGLKMSSLKSLTNQTKTPQV